MGGLQVADIARWDPVAIGDVATACKKLAVSIDDATKPLDHLAGFERWTGVGAGSAKWAMKDCGRDVDRFVAATKILGGATSIAEAPVEGLVRALVDITMTASNLGLRVIGETSTVAVAISTAGFAGDEIAEMNRNIEELQARVDKLVAEANRVDDDLAKALSKIADDGKESVWKASAPDVDALVVGVLTGAKVDLLGKYGAKALEGANSALLPWLKEIDLLKVSRIGVVGNVAMMIPAIIADVGNGDSVPKAVAKEAGGVMAGVLTGAGVGFAMGTSVPVIGNVGGVLVGGLLGGLASTGASKLIGSLYPDD